MGQDLAVARDQDSGRQGPEPCLTAMGRRIKRASQSANASQTRHVEEHLERIRTIAQGAYGRGGGSTETGGHVVLEHVSAGIRSSKAIVLMSREYRSVDGQTMARTPKRRVDTTVWTEVVKLEDIDEWHKCSKSW